MSLNWNIEKCGFEKDFQKDNWGVIEETIWSTMVVELGSITKDNVDKYEFRLRCYARASNTNYDRVIAFLPNMIGMNTNVFDKTDKQFEKKLIEVIIYDCQYEMNRGKTKVG